MLVLHFQTSMENSSEIHCESCKQTFSKAVAGGICPTCLLLAGMETQVGTAHERFQKSLPHQEFIADLFPELEGIQIIGRGGMSIVYRAHQRDLRRDIALKLLPLEHADREGWEARFEVEARAAARLDHPNIVTLYEFGTREGGPFLKMKLVEGGQTLADALKKRPRWQMPEAVALLVKMARAVHHAHQHGVIHRDIKPGNILLDADGEPYLTDFGLARLVEENTGLTGSHMVLGTANYMAPEQADGRNKDITTAVDVHALGAVLYEMLTGRPPFEGRSVAEILRRVCDKDPPAPHILNPEVDRDLSTICLKCMEKNPDRRYGSAESLEDELHRWEEGRPIIARQISSMGRIAKWARRNPGYAALISLLLLTALTAIAGFYYAWQLSEHSRRLTEDARIKTEKENILAQQRLEEALQGFTSEAGAQRMRVKAGHRWDAFAAIAKGVAIRVTPALRSEGVACLALADMKPVDRWRDETQGRQPSSMSADYQRHAQGMPDGSIQIRAYPGLKVLKQLPAQKLAVQRLLQFSPDRRRLAAGYGSQAHMPSEVIVWDVDLGKPLLKLTGVHEEALDFSPDSSLVFAATEKELQVWDLKSKKALAHAPLASAPWSVRASPDGRWIAVSHPHGGVDLCDAQTAAVSKSYLDCSSSFGIAWDPNSRWLAIPSDDGTVHVWDTVHAPLLERSWRAHSAGVKRAAWHPNGHHLVTESMDEEIILWEARLGEKLVDFSAQSAGQLAFSSDGRRLGLFRRGDQLSLLEVEDGGRVMRQSVGHERHQVHGASWNLEGLIMATAGEDMVKFWNREGEFVGSLPVAASRSVVWTSSALIVTGADGILRWPILQAPNGRDLKTLVLGQVETMDSRKGWQRAALRIEGSAGTHNRPGRWLAVTHPERILILDLESSKPPLEIEGQPNAAFVSISPDERLMATGSSSGSDVHIWSLPEGRPVHTLRDTGGANVLFSPDGSMLVTANNEEYKMWKTQDWSLIKTLRTHTGNYFGAMAFSPRMTALTLESERNRLRIIRPGNLEDLAAPDFDDQAPLAFSPDGVIMVDLDKKSHLIFWHLPELRAGMRAWGLDWSDLPPYPPIPVLSPVESVEFRP